MCNGPRGAFSTRIVDGVWLQVDGGNISAADIERWIVDRKWEPLAVRGLRFRRCYIGGKVDKNKIDLADRVIGIPIEFLSCVILPILDLSSSKIRHLRVRNCRVHAICLKETRVHGDLDFNRTCFPWRCADRGNTTPSIEATGIRVDGRVSLRKVVAFSGAFFARARVRGSFKCSGAFIASRHYTDRCWSTECVCAGSQEVTKSCPNCLRRIRWSSADIENSFEGLKRKLNDLYRGNAPTFPNYEGELYEPGNKADKALDLYGSDIGGNIYLHKGFTSLGEVSLNSSSVLAVHGDGCMFFQEEGIALSLDGVNVRSSVFLVKTNHFPCMVYGTATFRGARIGHRLVFKDVALYKPLEDITNRLLEDPLRSREGYAFYGNGLTVGNDVIINTTGDETATPQGPQKTIPP